MTTTAAVTRLSPNPLPWVRLDGVVVATNLDDVGRTRLKSPLNVDPSGRYVGGQQVWTGASSAGTTSGAETCIDWTSGGATGVVGLAAELGSFFSYSSGHDCSTPLNVYCFED